MTPQVSVVITTCNRPTLMPRAVRSALDQTLANIEVIVIIDGPSAETSAALGAFSDPRLRVEIQPERVGQASCINAAAALARAPWIAFLDDDDHWLPRKLEIQLRAAESSGRANPVAGCRFIGRGDRADQTWPRRDPRPDEPASEYLFCRSSLLFGEGILPTSVLLVPARLLRELPMRAGLSQHNDLDWLCRASAIHGATLVLPPEREPLAVWEMQQTRPRMSTRESWRFSYDWATSLRGPITPRAYAGFLLTWVSISARRQRDAAAFDFLLREAFRLGQPNLIELLVHFGHWALPFAAREKIAEHLIRKPA